jgi:hypothetical protein
MSGLAQIQRQLALARLQHHAAIILGDSVSSSNRAGADDVVGLFQRRQHGIEAAIDRIVALGPSQNTFLPGMVGDVMPGKVARTDDGVIGLVGDSDLAQLPLHRIRGPRRVGNEDHAAASLAKSMKRLAGFRNATRPL